MGLLDNGALWEGIEFLNGLAGVVVNDVAPPFDGTCRVDLTRLVRELPATCWVTGLFDDSIIAPFRQRQLSSPLGGNGEFWGFHIDFSWTRRFLDFGFKSQILDHVL